MINRSIQVFLVALVCTLVFALSACQSTPEFPKELRNSSVPLTLVVNDPGPLALINNQVLIKQMVWSGAYSSKVEKLAKPLNADDFRNIFSSQLQTSLTAFAPTLDVQKALTTAETGTIAQKKGKRHSDQVNPWEFSSISDKINTRYVLFVNPVKWSINAGPLDDQNPVKKYNWGYVQVDVQVYLIDTTTDAVLISLPFSGTYEIIDVEDMDTKDFQSCFSDTSQTIADQLYAYLATYVRVHKVAPKSKFPLATPPANQGSQTPAGSTGAGTSARSTALPSNAPTPSPSR